MIPRFCQIPPPSLSPCFFPSRCNEIPKSCFRYPLPFSAVLSPSLALLEMISPRFVCCGKIAAFQGSSPAGCRHRHNVQPTQAVKLATYLTEHPALQLIYRFKQKLCYLLLRKHRTRKQCQALIPRLLRAIVELKQAGLAPLVTLGQTP
jgi:hypothetical protein